MSSGSWLQIYIGCPFYKQDDGKTCVKCEGLVGGFADSSMGLSFQNREDFMKWVSGFCCRDYTKCSLYKIAAEKYKD